MQIKVFSFIIIILSLSFSVSAAEAKSNELVKAGNNVINSSEYEKNAGSTNGDWFAIAKCALSGEANFKYYDMLEQYVQNKYKTNNGLGNKKATDYSRIALCIEAVGGDSSSVGGENLVDDGVYNCDFLENQGINALVYGLICADCNEVKADKNAKYDKDKIISMIINLQNADGGFSQSGELSEVDITAMAVTALSIHCQNEAVASSVYSAKQFLESAQNNNGTFSLYSKENCESTAQAVIAFCSLKVNTKLDVDGLISSSTDALMRFYNGNDGFSHIYGEESDVLASQQGALAIAAYHRSEKNQYLFDFSEVKLEKKDYTFLLIATFFALLASAVACTVFILKRKEI